MVVKFDRQKTKHQLFHLSIGLATILFIFAYLQFSRSWTILSSFWKSLLIPIVFIGELLKVILARYYSTRCLDDGIHPATTPLPPKARGKKTATNVAVREFFSGLILQLVCMFIYGFICIILGAPVLHSFEQTFVLSALLTILTVSPTVFLMGGGGALQVCFCENPEATRSERAALELFKCHAMGAIIGAWAGAIVEPLDWDRDWQIYPIPNVLGALLGCALGTIYMCCTVLYGTAKVYMSKKRL